MTRERADARVHQLVRAHDARLGRARQGDLQDARGEVAAGRPASDRTLAHRPSPRHDAISGDRSPTRGRRPARSRHAPDGERVEDPLGGVAEGQLGRATVAVALAELVEGVEAAQRHAPPVGAE